MNTVDIHIIKWNVRLIENSINLLFLRLSKKKDLFLLFIFPFLSGPLSFIGLRVLRSRGDDGASRTKEHKWIRRVLPDD